MLLLLPDLLSAVVSDVYGHISMQASDESKVALVKLLGDDRAVIAGGSHDGVKVVLPERVRFKDGYMLVSLDRKPSKRDYSRTLDKTNQPLKASFVYPKVEIDYDGYCAFELLREPEYLCICGSDITKVAPQHKIALFDLYDLVRDHFLEFLNVGEAELKRRKVRQQFSIRRAVYFDRFCPSRHAAWYVSSNASKAAGTISKEDLAVLADYVSCGVHKSEVPLLPIQTPIQGYQPVWAIPYEFVGADYLCQEV